MAVRRLHMDLDQARQKQKALHMLILSGVVRPSHIGLRYIPLLSQSEDSPMVPGTAPSLLLKHYTISIERSAYCASG
ncbi:MAG: hypothetical protein JSS38_12455 [Nitrospira sp.]|nr:hypothetical protein [Nitrospira sp.]